MQTLLGKATYEAREFTTLREMLEQSAALYGAAPAFCFRRYPAGPVQLRTYEEYLEDVRALALELLDRGARRVAVIGENSYEWAVTYSAILHAGLIAVPLDRQLPVEEVLSLLKRSGSDHFFCSPKLLGHIEAVLEELPEIENCCFDTQWAGKTALELPKSEKVSRYSERSEHGHQLLRQAGKKLSLPEIDPEALALLLYTSGTTSQSKAVCLSHRNLCANIRQIAGAVKLAPGEKLLSILPMHHSFENTVGLQFPAYSGCTVCFADGLRYLAKNLSEWQVNAMIGVPLLYENIFKRVREGIEKSGKAGILEIMKPLGRGVKILSVKAHRMMFGTVLKALGGEIRLMVSGAAPIDPEVIRGFSDLGIEFLQGYGMTEHSPVISVCDSKHNSLGSVGHPLDGVEVAIDTEEEYRGAIGEIWVRSPAVMQGYYENEEATREALDAEGWLHTGDMGFLDNKDCLHITGRTKNMIVLENGKKVFPEECEELFNRIAGVRESYVWGETGEAVGGDVDLAVLLELETPALEKALDMKLPGEAEAFTEEQQEQVRSYLQNQVQQACASMPAFKKVKYFLYTREPMQRTASMKIRRQPQLARIHAFLSAENARLREVNGREMK